MTETIVPPDVAEHIDNIFAGMVKVGGLLAMSRDGIGLRQVYKKGHHGDAGVLPSRRRPGGRGLAVHGCGPGPSQGLHPHVPQGEVVASSPKHSAVPRKSLPKEDCESGSGRGSNSQTTVTP